MVQCSSACPSICLPQHGPTAANPPLQVRCCGTGRQIWICGSGMLWANAGNVKPQLNQSILVHACVWNVSDEIEVAHLKTLTRDDVLKFYQVSAAWLAFSEVILYWQRKRPIQLAKCWFPGLAISNAEILIYFSSKICRSNFCQTAFQNGYGLKFTKYWLQFKKKFIVLGLFIIIFSIPNAKL